MSSSFVVVVMLMAVVCAIAVATVVGRRSPMTVQQPATTWRPAALAGDPSSREAPWVPAHFDDDPQPDRLVEPLPPGRRLRAVTLLTTSIVVLGAATAAAIGATALLLVRIVNQALGL